MSKIFIHGIYAYKVDPNKEIENYKETKLGNVQKALMGKKEESYYYVLWLVEDHDKSSDEIIAYNADFIFTSGEIFDISDQFRKRSGFHASIKDVKTHSNGIEFIHEDLSIKGVYGESCMYVTMLNIKTREESKRRFRFIPWGVS
jgi:hypothetical protein